MITKARPICRAERQVDSMKVVLMRKRLKVSVCKVARLSLISDGRMGATKERAERIKLALTWRGGTN